MSKKKSSNQSKAKKEKVLSIVKELETKGNAKNSAIESVKDLVVGAIGGGIAGAAVGKPSLLVGFGTSLIGHYMGSSLATSFGLGMMASGGYQIGSGAVNGTTPTGVQGAKERIKLFGANIKQRLYLDKIIKPKDTPKDETTSGLGEVQYFKYPEQGTGELDTTALDKIESAIAQSGEQFHQKQMSGAYDDDMSGIDDEKIY